jgi:uncharacterized protein (DUF2236 family)
MTGLLVVSPGVLALRLVAAAHVTAAQAEPQVDPAHASGQALLTAAGLRSDVPDRVEVGAWTCPRRETSRCAAEAGDKIGHLVSSLTPGGAPCSGDSYRAHSAQQSSTLESLSLADGAATVRGGTNHRVTDTHGEQGDDGVQPPMREAGYDVPVMVVDAVAADPVDGFYGPDSQMWRINREAVLLAAGPAALLLQIAHPLVAEGVAAHSDFRADPFARLRRTLRTTLGLVFGDGPTAERAVRRLNEVHGWVRGEVLDPVARQASGDSSYRALDPELLLWVQATLLITGVEAYRRWVGPVTAADREALWSEASRVGRRLGIPASSSPADWPGLVAWYERQLAPGGPVVVTPTARTLADAIVHPPIRWLPTPLADLALLPAWSLLPAHLRDAFGIPWSTRRAFVARGLGAGLRAWIKLTPHRWRAMPQARSAERRAARVRQQIQPG